jgi:signal transduction histidine kinase
VARAEQKLRALVETGIAITSELALDAVLERVLEAAAELTGARYAALGVIDRDGKSLERFLAHGVTPDEHAAIGDLPLGRGLLGALIRDARPLRLSDLGDDPRSVGFPPNHPPMRSFLGVPVLLRGVAYGNLYLTEKRDGAEFTVDDEEIVSLLAAQAAVAIENARLYESELRWSSQLEALEEIAVALAGEAELPRQLELVAARLQPLLSARIVAVALVREDGTLLVQAGSGEDVAGIVLRADTKTAQVLSRRRSELVDSLRDDPEVDQRLVERYDAHSALIVPLLVGGRALGVLIAIDKAGPDQRFDAEDLRLAESYARRAAVAVDLSQRVARDALRRAVAAQELERRRIARELHDETGQALTSILLGISSVDPDGDKAELRDALTAVRELAVSTLQDVRRLAVELRPKTLDDFGLLPALRRLGQSVSERTPLDVQVEARLGEQRLTPEAETAVYRIVQEALTNVVRHADASHVSVVLTRKNAGVSVVIEDDGRGFDPEGASDRGGLGLLGMRERVQLLDGTLDVDSTPGSGTALILHLPLQ